MSRILDLTTLLDTAYIENYVDVGSLLQVKQKNQFQSPLRMLRFVVLDENFFYSLGLWSGDKYYYGASVGLTNKNLVLIRVFQDFLASLVCDSNRIKVKSINNGEAMRVYANSTLLRRILEALCQNPCKLVESEREFYAYLSGKIDADGTVMPYNRKYRTGLIKITAASLEEARADLALLNKFGLRGCILAYKGRNAFDLKITYLDSLFLSGKLTPKDDNKFRKLGEIKAGGRESSCREVSS